MKGKKRTQTLQDQGTPNAIFVYSFYSIPIYTYIYNYYLITYLLQAKPPNHSTVANIHTENLLIDL